MPEARAILERALVVRSMSMSDNPYCLPSPQTGRPLSDVAVSKLLREAGYSNATVHGFRSCFRDWAAEIAEAPREIAEACLAHAPIGGKTEGAYLRRTMLKRRSALMGNWGAFVLGRPATD